MQGYGPKPSDGLSRNSRARLSEGRKTFPQPLRDVLISGRDRGSDLEYSMVQVNLVETARGR